MPKVGGKEYAYSPEGRAKARSAAQQQGGAMPGGNEPGPSIKDPELYEKMKKRFMEQGMPEAEAKEKAARMSNAQADRMGDDGGQGQAQSRGQARPPGGGGAAQPARGGGRQPQQGRRRRA